VETVTARRWNGWKCTPSGRVVYGQAIGYMKGAARFMSSSSPGSFGLRGFPGWMMDTWQLSAASTSSRYVPALISAM
jgi:hypothetical protein